MLNIYWYTNIYLSIYSALGILFLAVALWRENSWVLKSGNGRWKISSANNIPPNDGKLSNLPHFCLTFKFFRFNMFVLISRRRRRRRDLPFEENKTESVLYCIYKPVLIWEKSGFILYPYFNNFIFHLFLFTRFSHRSTGFQINYASAGVYLFLGCLRTLCTIKLN